MQYDEYGNDDYTGDELEGLSIQDNLHDVMQDQDMADAWLADRDEDSTTSNSEAFGMATAETLQLGRIGHLEYRLQAGIKELLLGNDVTGIHPVDAAAAREQFAEEIGSKDLVSFARQIKIDESITPPSQERELNQVVSILQNSSGTYMTRGAGGALAGHNLFGEETEWQQENQGRADEDLLKAISYVKEIADVYLDDRTRGSSVEDARRQALEESITKRMIDGTFYEGSGNVLPLPNETGVTGIKSTQGIYGSFQGTAEDRLSASQFDELYQQMPSTGRGKTRFIRDDQGYKVFREEVTQEQRNDALRRTPSLANSLFPKPRAIGKQTFTSEEKSKQARDQKFLMSQLQTKANIARKILRQETITSRDESKGNQLRMAGWDTPYGEQADLQNLRNEAAIQGEEWNSFYSGQVDDDYKQSSMNDLVKEMVEEQEQSTISASQDSPKQGTKEWLAQRKGKITASTATGLLKEGGIEERATELAMERLGTSVPFTGNAHTREGTEGEDKAAAAFLASKHGVGLTMAEAFFEENEEIPGFGVSPDGRLYDDEGESAGLLELKYLSSGSMEGALKKYTPQVQMQMAITGESQTHFFALDKYTGEYVHELVQADPVMQKELISAGTQALELGASLDNRGIQALRKEIKSKKKPRAEVGAKEEVIGQQESISIEDEIDEPMTAFQADVMAATKTPASGGIASQSLLAKKMMQQDQRDKAKAALDNARDLPEDTIVFDQVQNMKDQAAAKNAFVAGNQRTAFGDSTDLVATEMSAYYKAEESASRAKTKEEAQERRMAAAETAAYKESETRAAPSIEAVAIENQRGLAGARNTFIENNQRAAFGDTNGELSDMASFYKSEEARAKVEATEMASIEGEAYAENKEFDKKAAAADKETADAAKEASSNLREFGKSVREAGKILGELSDIVLTGNKSGMDEVRLAAESGIDVAQVRGMREAMEMGGMDTTGINKVVSQASSLVTTFNDEATAAGKFTDIMSARGRSNIEAVRTMEMPSIQEFQNMDAQQLTAKVASMMQGQSAEAKTQIGNIFGMTSLAASDISPEMISGLDKSINEEGLRATQRGIQTVEQVKREAMEEAGEIGETGGSIASGTAITATVLGSATVGFVASKAGKLMNAAKPNSMGAKAIKNLSTAAKATPLTLAASVAPMAVRAVGDIKDDGGVGDSLMDVAEFATYGAAIGSVVPGIGTAVGAGAGALVGIGNEAWEYFSADDAVPSADIGNMPMQGKDATKSSSNTVNVEVTNEISPDLIRTTTNVDGDLNIDEETGIGTGG